METPTVEEKMDAAGDEIAALHKQIDNINRRMDALDVKSPEQIRRETLNEVLDVLFLENDVHGYMSVHRMIRDMDAS